jgi:transcriptional regulator of acetoin/glycerol metabolism
MSERPPHGGADDDRTRRSTKPPLHVSARVTEDLARDPEAARLLAVLDTCDWNQTRAAKELGVSRRTLVSRLSAYGLTRKRGR